MCNARPSGRGAWLLPSSTTPASTAQHCSPPSFSFMQSYIVQRYMNKRLGKSSSACSRAQCSTGRLRVPGLCVYQGAARTHGGAAAS